MTSRFGKFARSIVVLILVASTLLVLAGKAITESFSTAFPSEPIISDQTFVFNPDLFGFDVAGFLSKQSSSLAGYTEVLDGETVTAADLIASKAHYYSINPQVFLTLLEVRWGAVSAGSAGNPPLFAAGGGPATMSLDAELEAMAQSLFIAYYGFLDDPASQAGTSSGLNAGTVAIASYLGQAIQDSTALEQALGSGPQGFSGLYALLFGDPMAGDLVNQGPQTPMAGARLPWAAGGVWNYNSGPHRYQGGQYNPLCPWGAPGCPGPWSSLDFGTMNPVSCNPNTPDDDGKYSPDWVA
ncbi:MAG TPA: hypothetical protein VF434_01875, partial [Promineifilum sp.]